MTMTTPSTARRVEADPYAWPYDAGIDPTRTALVNIDWQVDFCGKGGYVDTMGYDLNLTRAGLEPTAVVLDAARAAGWTIVHTREGHRPDLSDCPPEQAVAVARTSVPASVTRARVVGSWSGASRAGRSSPRSHPSTAS